MYPRLGGIVLDDASWDDNNVLNGLRFSDFIGRLLKPEAYITSKPVTVVTKKQRNTAGMKTWFHFSYAML